jgi:short-subunit dehydrogenase
MTSTTQPAPPVSPPALAGVPANKRRAIVVGASSGMGAALVRQLAGEGYQVAALARRESQLEELASSCAEACAESGGRVLTRVHDVRDTEAIPALFEELVRELGGLDLMIYAAGIMPSVEPDEYDTEKDLAMLSVNLGGCIAWCNPTANYFRSHRAGTIVGISSIAGDRGRRGAPVYGTSKAAMNTYLEALRNRLGEWGVHVCTIKPGFIDTAMTQGMEGLFWVISPEEAARTILAAARNRVNTRYVPLRWQLVGTVIKSIPSFLFKKLNV